MKKFLVFTALLVSSLQQLLACGYSPYGEDVRYCLFLPSYFDYKDFASFNYNANLFGFETAYSPGYESNVTDWYHFVGKKVSVDAINEFMYDAKITDIHPDSNNDFIDYLYKTKATAILQYLTMAKKSEVINSAELYDAWERKDAEIQIDRKAFFKQLMQLYQKENSIFLKRKYAFLAIRVAYYAKDFEQIHSLYETVFKNEKKDYLYYWSLYFDCFSKENAAVSIANVMANSAEKREATYYYFHKDFDLQQALAQASNEQEQANVYAYASVQKVDKNLDFLREIYVKDPKSRIFSFLLLREINKIEDWVYTPYYTNYLPSITFANTNYESSVISTTNLLRERSENDRLYAQEVLEFVDSLSLSAVENAMLVSASKIQLLFITKKFEACLAAITPFEAQYPNEKVFDQIQKIKALCLVSNQAYNEAVIPQAVEPIILKYQSDSRFLFALGRELEFLNNKVDGIALIASANPYDSKMYNSEVEWQGNRLAGSGNLKMFYTYFDYLDFVYAPSDLQKIVDRISQKPFSSFEKIIYRSLVKNKESLMDLLGTKYIRENDLTRAYAVFNAMGDAYWQDNYNAWERGKLDENYAFDSNPFYDFKYTANFIAHKESFLVSKLSVTQHLIKYLNLASNPNTRDRDYYYFLVANCYLNMSQAGNSWMMRRFSSSYNDSGSKSYIDQIEYQNAQKAQHYYELAFENAKTAKFKALCLRMQDYAKGGYMDPFDSVEKQYPQFDGDLSYCESLKEFFNARR
ncbi:hypothetical protein FFWV33_18740 [Flavobacterium faecale]|uniref:Uncharacterized protein n=1 Tax=Flavobacterium faecale TaxID=1355330 RepID=A0A2S1LI11_9FLAO|nr:hypothetical protein [Flavobacterium faecale]AWG23422.1 hypothetical protein FFWV33_18740 [Flavobacterium faecale]